MSTPDPTPYPDVNAVLHRVLTEVRAILRSRFVGMYLYGSLALDAFAPDRSDIDFLVVTTVELSDDLVAALQAMHRRIGADDSPWAIELEGSYIPRDALRRHDPARARHPHIDRGDSALAVEQHDSDWVIQRYVLREHGIALAGPPITTLIDPISPDQLRRAVWELIDGWWAPMLDDPTRLRSRGYQDYAVLTMCRMLYTLRHGTIVPKPAAARWAQGELDARWAPTIERALALGHDSHEATLAATLDLMRHVVERLRREEMERSASPPGKTGCAGGVDWVHVPIRSRKEGIMAGPIQTGAVHHLRLTVSNPERAREFYTGVLNFQVAVSLPNGFLLSNESVLLGIGAAPERATPGDRFDENRVGLDHLSFSVSSRQALEEAARALDERGIAHGGVKDLGADFGLYILAFRDPDNIQLELTATYS